MISMLIPVLKNSKKAKVTEIMIDILIFLYCLALIFLSIIDFIFDSLSFRELNPLKMSL